MHSGQTDWRGGNDADLQIGALEPGTKAFTGGLDDLRFYERALSGPEIKTAAIDYPAQVILSGVGGKPSKEEEERLRDYYLRFVAPESFRRLYSELKTDREQLAELDKQILTTMVMSEIEKKRRPDYILGRGDYRNKLEEVTPGVPSVLPPIRTTPVVPSAAPATSHYIITASDNPADLDDGAGPAKAAPEDLEKPDADKGSPVPNPPGPCQLAAGSQPPADRPSRCEPLLADVFRNRACEDSREFRLARRTAIASGTARLARDGVHPHRLGCESDAAADRHLRNLPASLPRATPALLEKDPENRLLARGPRFRLPAEMVRDNALAVSGLLNDEVGGPSVFPYQPAGLVGRDGVRRRVLHADLCAEPWRRPVPPQHVHVLEAHGAARADDRRSMRRTARSARLDGPSTNTPLQALVLMNDPTYLEAARALAERVIHGEPDVGRAHARRSPSELSPARAAAGVEASGSDTSRETADRILTAKSETEAAAAADEWANPPPDTQSQPAELAAWTMVASAILNLDETITKE